MARRKLSKQRREYLNYLRTTIIPDTEESGRDATAEDLRTCASLIARSKTNAKFARYLRTTLIPDFRASGSEGYVEDFQTCARYVAPRTPRRR